MKGELWPAGQIQVAVFISNFLGIQQCAFGSCLLIKLGQSTRIYIALRGFMKKKKERIAEINNGSRDLDISQSVKIKKKLFI